jgi:hypothetical protein
MVHYFHISPKQIVCYLWHTLSITRNIMISVTVFWNSCLICVAERGAYGGRLYKPSGMAKLEQTLGKSNSPSSSKSAIDKVRH